MPSELDMEKVVNNVWAETGKAYYKPETDTNWCHLPLKPRSECVKWMDFKTKSSLRATSRLEKLLVENEKHRDCSISKNKSVPLSLQPLQSSLPADIGPKILNETTKFVIINWESPTRKPHSAARIIDFLGSLGFSDHQATQLLPMESQPTLCSGYARRAQFSCFQSGSNALHAWLPDQKPVKVDTKWTMVVPYSGSRQYPLWLYYFWLDTEVRTSGVDIFKNQLWQGPDVVEKIVGDIIKSVTPQQAKKALLKLSRSAQNIVRHVAHRKGIEFSYWTN